jgi:hypothetical protein
MKIMKKKNPARKKHMRNFYKEKFTSRSVMMLCMMLCMEKQIRTIQVIKCLHGIHRSGTLCVATKRKYLETKSPQKKTVREIRKVPVRRCYNCNHHSNRQRFHASRCENNASTEYSELKKYRSLPVRGFKSWSINHER